MSSTGECFDIGYTTVLALRKYLEDKNPFAGSLDPDSAGNGALMRLAPFAMYYAQDETAVFHYAGESTRTTHCKSEAIECSRLFGLQLRAALCGATKDEILSIDYPEPLSPKLALLAGREFLGKPVDRIKGSGYCVQSLESALWCFWHTTSFKDAVLKAANLGDDADTTAAICGQIAGAFYSVEQIPDEWVGKLAMSEEILNLSDRLFAERYAPTDSAQSIGADPR